MLTWARALFPRKILVFCAKFLDPGLWALGLIPRAGAGGIPLLLPKRPYTMKCLGFRLL